MSEELTQPELTPEQQLAALDAQYVERQKLEEKAKEQEAEQQRLTADKAELQLTDTVRDARKESGYAFYSPTPELIKLLRVEPGFHINAVAGAFYIDGQPVELVEMLRAFAERHRWSREKTKEERAIARGQKETGIQCKDDLRTTQDKVNYVAKFGRDAFTRLPQHAPVDDAQIQHMTLAQFSKLPREQKVRFVAKHGEAAVAALSRNK